MAAIDARDTLEAGGERYEIHRLSALEDDFDVGRLPYSMKVLLENLLRHNDGVRVTDDDVAAAGAVGRAGPPTVASAEISFLPARVLMQDFTGVPAVVDLAAMRHAVAERGGDPADARPADPGRPGHRPLGAGRRVRPARGPGPQRRAGVRAQPRALPVPAVGPAGVRPVLGGAARHRHLPPGQPRVPGHRGRHPRRRRLPRHARRHRLAHADGQRPGRGGLGRRRHRGRGRAAGPAHLDARPRRSWGSSCRASCPRARPPPTSSSRSPTCCGPRAWSAASSSSTARAWPTCRSRTGRRSATCRPSTGRRSRSSRSTTRPCATCASPAGPTTCVALVEAYAKEQGLWHDPAAEPVFTETLELDLGTVEPSIAGPARPQDRVPLREAKARFAVSLLDSLPATGAGGPAPRPHRCRSATATTTPTPSRSPPATRPPPSATARSPTSRPASGPLDAVPTRCSGRRTSRLPVHLDATAGLDEEIEVSSTTATSPSPPSRAARTPRTRR